jgi:excisionase family DNA binding protein
MGNKPWLSVRELADALDVSVVRAGTLCREGRVPAVRNGGRWIVPRKAFAAWVERYEAAARARMQAHETRRVVGG